jgi:hypothetical protein
MVVESIVLAIFIFSFGGAVLILVRKAPILSTLPQNGSTGFKNHKFISGIENKIKKTFSLFSDKIILHKFLSWFRCQIIKIETQVDKALHGIRKKANNKKK